MREKKLKEVVEKTSLLTMKKKGKVSATAQKRIICKFGLFFLLQIWHSSLLMSWRWDAKQVHFGSPSTLSKMSTMTKNYFCKLFCRIFFLDNSFKMYENDEVQDVFLDDHCHQSIIEIMIFQKFSFFIK